MRVVLLFEVLPFVVRATVAAATGVDDDDNDTAVEALRGVRAVRADDAERPVDTTTGGMDVAVAVAPLRFRDTGAAFTVVSMVADSMKSRFLVVRRSVQFECPVRRYHFFRAFRYMLLGVVWIYQQWTSLSSEDFQVRSS